MIPTLTEPGVKYFLSETLKNCRKQKFEYNNVIFNTSLFLVFVFIFGLVIYFSYKRKENNNREIENERKQQYIMNMVNKINSEKQKKNGNKITDLPEFESEFEITMKKFL